MISAGDFRNGITIELDNNVYQIIEFQHVKPGKGAAIVKAKLKNLRTGGTIERTFNTNVKFEKANINRSSVQYLYNTGDTYCFMNMETYEQIEIPTSHLEWEKNFLQEGMNCDVMLYENEVLTIELPDKVECIVTQCDPAVRGDTKTNALKDAFLESGFLVKVPMFIEQDEKIIVSTKTGEYAGRA